jgi:hypothetical protein
LLRGTGWRKEEWLPYINTDDDQLEFLKTLKAKATRSRAKYYAAQRAVKAAMPFWMTETDTQEAESAARRHKFLDDVESINL